MKIFSSKQLYEADRITTEKQEVTAIDLMERAGTQIFNWLHERMQGAKVPIHIFCGIGNNGGDGLVMGRLLIEHGYNAQVYIANYTDKRSQGFLTNYDRIKGVTKNWPLLMTCEADFPKIEPQDVIIDALFGIGLNRPAEGWVKALIQHMNAIPAFTLAIDVPSGLYAEKAIEDTDAVVKANHTLAFQAPKLAFFMPENTSYVSYFEVLDIGLDQEYLATVTPLAQLIAKPEAQQFYKQRKKDDHKGTFGHSLVIAGSYGKIGSAVLAAKACFRSGAGLVSCFIPACGYNVMQTALPEAMVITNDEGDFITKIEYAFEPSAIAIGMGMGTKAETVSALESFLKSVKAPLVIDADALNCISENPALLEFLPKHSMLTPHPKELERLIGAWKNDYDKLEKVKVFVNKYDVLIVIKGAHTMVVFGDSIYINTTGNPGMATAGSGDVLSGMITGLLSQGYDVLLASVFAVYLHGSAGNLASHELSYEAVMASDIIDYIGQAYIELFRQEQPPEGEQK